jgi:hypothetical protein
MNRLVAAVAVTTQVGLAVLAPPTARADDNSGDAMALFDLGMKDMQAGNFELACKELAASNEKLPDSGTKGALATCYTQLGKVASAWRLWRDLADTAPSEDMKRDAASYAFKLEARLPRFVIRLKGVAAPGLKVTAGGIDVADPTLAAPLPIDPGAFTVLATAPDYVEWTMDFTAAEGKTTTVEVPALVARPKPKPTTASTPLPTLIMHEDVNATRRSRHIVGLSIGLVGVAALAVGGVFGSIASSQWDTAQKDCNNNIANCPAGQASVAQAEVNTARTSALVSTLGISIGAVGAIVGTIIFLSAPAAEQPSAATTAWRVVPALSPASTGVVVSRNW